MSTTNTTVTGRVVIKRPTGTVTAIVNKLAPYLDIKLDPSLEYDVAFDQSTSVIGLAIESTCGRLIVALDFKNPNETRSKDYFLEEVYRFLKRTLEGKKIRMLILEEPPTVDYGYGTTMLLKELAGYISSWRNGIEELYNCEYERILPQVWRSMLKIKAPKGCKLTKYEIAKQICASYPELAQYLENYPWHDYDGFEALGILKGFKLYAYNEYGVPQIHGIKEKRHTSYVFYKYVDLDAIECVEDCIAECEVLEKVVPFKYLYFNERYKFFDNVRMASSNYDVCYCFLPEEQFDVIKWKFNLQKKKRHSLLMVVARKDNKVNDPFIRGLRSIFPMNEEIVNDKD